VKVKRPGREPEHSHSVQVKNSGAVSVLAVLVPSWPVLEQLLPVTSYFLCGLVHNCIFYILSRSLLIVACTDVT
jgi:hypothetical protein